MAGNYNLGTAAGRILIDGAGAEIGFGIAQQAGSAFFDAIESQLQSIKSFGQDMMKAGAVGAAGFAIAGNAAMNYEARLSAVKAVSGASAEQMAQISEAALKIGADTSFSATEAAMAFEELVKAGISVQDALDGAALATANLAAAGEIALPRAAEIAANAMNNFNLSGEDMPRIADLVAGAANASAISVEEFAQSLSQVGAVANLAGVSFDDTAVAIAEMGNAGIKGSDAGTSLKTMLMNLQPVTKAQSTEFQKLGLLTYDAEDAMKSLAKKGITPVSGSLEDVRGAISDYLEETEGIKNDTKEMGKAVDEWLMKNAGMQNAFFDSTGKAKGLADMQEELAKATSGMTEEQKLASLEILFGSDAIRAAAIMAKNGKAGFDELAISMGKVTAADVAAERLNNVKGSIEKLKGSFETLLIQLGLIFLPTVKKVIDGMTEFVNWLTSASERARTFVVSLGAAGTAIALVGGGLITALAALTPFLAKLIGMVVVHKIMMGAVNAVKFLSMAFTTATGPLSFYRILVQGLTGVYAGAAVAAGRASAAVGIFGRVLGFALGPWGRIIQLVGLFIAAGVVLYNTWEPFRQLVDGIAGILGGVFNAAMAGAQTIISKLVDGFNGMEAASDPVSQALFAVGQAANMIWQDLQKLGQLVLTNVVPALQELWGILQGAFGAAFAQIAAVVASDLMPALQRLADVFFTQVFPALQQVAGFLLPIVGFLYQVAGAVAGVLFTALIYLVSFLIGTVLPAIIQFAGPVLGFLISAIAAVATFIVQYLITPFINLVTFLFGTVIPGVIAFGAALVQSLIDAFIFVQEAIANVVGFFSAMFTAIGAFFAPFVELFVAYWNVIFALTNGILQLLFAVIQFVFGTIALYIQTTLASMAQGWADFWNGLMEFLQPALDWILAIITGVWIALFGQVDSGNKSMLQSITFLWDWAMAFIGGALGFIGALIADNWNRMLSDISNICAAIGAVIAFLWNNAVSMVQGAMGWLNDITGGGFNRMVSIIQIAMGMLGAAITNKWNEIIGFFQSIPGIIQGIFSGAGGWLANAGRQIIDGLLSGLRGAAGAITDFFAGLTAKIPQIKGPPEHDKVMLIPAGQMIMTSLWKGLDKGKDAVYDLLNDMNATIPATIDAVFEPKQGKMALDPMRLTGGMPVSPLNITNTKEESAPSETYLVDKLIVNNAVPEKASESLPKAIRQLSTVGPRSKRA